MAKSPKKEFAVLARVQLTIQARNEGEATKIANNKLKEFQGFDIEAVEEVDYV